MELCNTSLPQRRSRSVALNYYVVARRASTNHATQQQARNQGRQNRPKIFFSPLGKMCWASFKTVGHNSKYLGPSQKTLRPS